MLARILSALPVSLGLLVFSTNAGAQIVVQERAVSAHSFFLDGVFGEDAVTDSAQVDFDLPDAFDEVLSAEAGAFGSSAYADATQSSDVDRLNGLFSATGNAAAGLYVQGSGETNAHSSQRLRFVLVTPGLLTLDGSLTTGTTFDGFTGQDAHAHSEVELRIVDSNGIRLLQQIVPLGQTTSLDGTLIGLGPGEYEVLFEARASDSTQGIEQVNGSYAVATFSVTGRITGGGTPFLEGCDGDGGNQLGCTDCPCGNNAPEGTIGGCLNSSGASGRLKPSGSPSVSGQMLRFEGSGLTPESFAILISGLSIAPTNPGNPCFGQATGLQSSSLDGLRCVVAGVVRHGARSIDGMGEVGSSNAGWGAPNNFVNFAAFSSGTLRHFQLTYRDTLHGACGTEQNTTQRVTVELTP